MFRINEIEEKIKLLKMNDLTFMNKVFVNIK